MPNIIDDKKLAKLEELTKSPDSIIKQIDEFGNACFWLELDDPNLILEVAKIMAEANARLVTTTAYNECTLLSTMPFVCYHFAIQGTLYNITVSLKNKDTALPSIVSFFKNADWNEREMMELNSINIINHPNPVRLFLDDQIEEGILSEAIPLSIMMNGACTVDLWERILKDRAENND